VTTAGGGTLGGVGAAIVTAGGATIVVAGVEVVDDAVLVTATPLVDTVTLPGASKFNLLARAILFSAADLPPLLFVVVVVVVVEDDVVVVSSVCVSVPPANNRDN
jgi:hypothetical protein